VRAAVRRIEEGGLLAGRYDAVLDFGPDDLRPNGDSSEAIGFPPLPGALEKQLGLKLVKQNAQS
jgi:uncharacterized protein (TIGR03435 family)